MSVLRAVVDHFLLPGAPAAPPAPARIETARQSHAAVGVLCSPRDAAALGVAVGAGLAREHGSRAVLVCSWGAPARRPGPALPATGAARGLARSLIARGLRAAASGRLVLVAAEDAADAGRALAAAPGPTVLVVAGPRDAEMDAVLRAQDHVVVADTGEAGVAALAETLLAADGVRTARCAVPSGLARRVPALGARTPVDLRGERGQATILVLALLLAVVIGAVVLGAAARGVGAADERGRAADLAALAGARAMHDGFDGLFEPATLAAARTRGTSSSRSTSRAAAARRSPRPGATASRTSGSRSRTGTRWRRCASGSPSAIRSPRATTRCRWRGPPRRSSRRRRPRRSTRRSAPASTAARSRSARGSRCARTSRWRSTAWRRRRAPTA